MLRVDMYKRWDANMILTYCQYDFIVDIQRVYRGFTARREFKRRAQGVKMLQANIRGFVTRSRFQRSKGEIRERSILLIQAFMRGHFARKEFRRQKHLVMRLQANVLTKQYRGAFVGMRQNTRV